MHYDRMVLFKDYWMNFPKALPYYMKEMLRREHISGKYLLNRCLWSGSTPLHRKTPSDRDVLLNLYHSAAQLWSYKCLLGTPSSHNDHYSRQQTRRCNFKDSYCCARQALARRPGWYICSICDSRCQCGKPTKTSSWAINKRH